MANDERQSCTCDRDGSIHPNDDGTRVNMRIVDHRRDMSKSKKCSGMGVVGFVGRIGFGILHS